MTKIATDIPTEQIARRAYEIWEARGRPASDGSEDWDAAVAELASGQNGGAHGVALWWHRLRQKITGRDS